MATLSIRDRFSLAVLGAKALVTGKPEPSPMLDSILNKIYPGRQGDPPDRGAYGILESYSTMPWLRACAGRVANSMSSVQWRIYVTRKTPTARAYRDRGLQRAGYELRKTLIRERAESGELEEVTNHPFLDIMTKGNGYHSGVALRRIESLHMDLVGETFMLKGRNALGAVTSLWPIPPPWVFSTPTPAWPYYRMNYRGWHENIPASEILWMSDPNPANPYGRGIGLGQAIADEAEIDEYAAKTTRQVFFNRAQPDFLIYPKGERGEMNPTETKRFEQDWLNRLQGYWRTSKPHFMSREVGVYEFQKNLKEMMLTEVRMQERDIILQVWGMPPEKLGILNNSNRATIEGSDLIYAKDVLVPRLEMRRSMFQELLMPEYDDRLIVDYVTPVMEDKEFELKVAMAAPWAMNANEWRSIMGRGDLEQFNDVIFVPPSITPVRIEDLLPPANVDLGPTAEQETLVVDAAEAEPVDTLVQDVASKANYRGTEINLEPTAGMRSEAKKALAWRAEFNRGGTDVGVNSARRILSGDQLSRDLVVKMASYFARHEVDKQGEGYSPGEKGFPSAGRIAWGLWGGDAGQTWSSAKRDTLYRIDEQS